MPILWAGGASSIFTFDIKGDATDAQKFIDNLPIFSLLANVADEKSLEIHPASTIHEQLTPEELAEQGIKETIIRLSMVLGGSARRRHGLKSHRLLSEILV